MRRQIAPLIWPRRSAGSPGGDLAQPLSQPPATMRAMLDDADTAHQAGAVVADGAPDPTAR